MDMTPLILTGNVMHKRFFPKENGFTYGIYYIAFPLSQMMKLNAGWRFGVNGPALSSFHEKDHGLRDGSNLEAWVRNTLMEKDIMADGEIMLICMPRVLGHVFNPVSFFLCHDAGGNLRAVLYEVNNTFGESHSYLCSNGGDVISEDDWRTAEKLFHVSPFLPREGYYRFRFNAKPHKIGVWIDYHAADGRKQLATALTGTFQPWTKGGLNRVFLRYPLVSLVALIRIHWHALRLILKRIKYIQKPPQIAEKISSGGKITKM